MPLHRAAALIRLLRNALASLALLLIPALSARADEPWQTLKNCQLLPNEANDGDSFHVRAAGREYIFRLYFLDTPETDQSVPGRVAEQAAYFHLSEPQTLQIGLAAERFTCAKLGRPFTVITRKEDARGRSHLPRYFAFVLIGSENLAEDLVANGLARVYGETAEAPGTRSPDAEKTLLRELESRAKTQRLGAWGMAGSPLKANASTPPAPNGREDAFNAFFHPSVATPAATAGAPATAASGTLDINRATLQELQSCRGLVRS